MDKLRALEVFCAVAETQGLAGAARKLSLSPPTVTRIINELEAELSAPLLHRTTRTVSLTDTGAAYLTDAKRILDEMKAADAAARGAQANPTGVLRITASVLFGQHYIAPILREYVDLYPDVRVDAVFLDRVVGLVNEGFDIAVRIGQLPDSTLRAARIGAVRRVVCACPDYLAANGIPQDIDDLTQHRIINFGLDGIDVTWRFDNGRSVKLSPRLSFSTIAACIASAKAGWGLTRVLSYQIGPELGDGALQTVLSDLTTQELPVHLVHSEGRHASAKVRAFLDLARDRLRRNPFLN